jgi:tetratricopeptide (TPR) repeat protein
LLIVLSCLATGCQWLGQNLMQNDRVAEKRRQRADAFARGIDQQHEQADLVAARDLWQRGDHESCKRRLNELLTRNPEQLDARLLLAEVLLDENQAQEGIRVLKPAETAHHDDARVQYTMGLLLDASGSQEGARSHYQAAAMLEPGNEVYTVSYNEAITSAKGIAPPGGRENKDLSQSDPSVPPPPDNTPAAGDRLAPAATPAVRSELAMPAAGTTSGLSRSAGGTPGAQANAQPAPGPMPQEFQLPVILQGTTPLPALGDDQPGPQVVRQDFSSLPPLPPGADPGKSALPPGSPPGDSAPVAATSSASICALRPELPMPMILALPSSPNVEGKAELAPAPKELPMMRLAEMAAAVPEVSILAASPAAAPAAAQPGRLPLEAAPAKKLQPEEASPSLRFVVPADNSGVIEVSDRSGDAAGVDRTSHSEPIDPAGLSSNLRSTVTQPSGDAPSPRPPVSASPCPRVPESGRPAAAVAQAGGGTPSPDPARNAAAEDLLRQGAEALSAGKTDVAMAFFREAAASRPHDPQIPISAAVAALRQNHPEAAVDLLAAAAGRFPKSAAVYRALGTACYRRTDYRAAQSALKQALLLDKANPLSYFLMGCTLVKLGQQPAADEFFRQARLLDPKYAVPRQPGQMP